MSPLQHLAAARHRDVWCGLVGLTSVVGGEVGDEASRALGASGTSCSRPRIAGLAPQRYRARSSSRLERNFLVSPLVVRNIDGIQVGNSAPPQT